MSVCEMLKKRKGITENNYTDGKNMRTLLTGSVIGCGCRQIRVL